MSNIDKLIHYNVASYFTFVSFVVIQYFDQIEQYILCCDYLPVNDEMINGENCSEKHHYKCVSGKHIKRNNMNQIKISMVIFHCLRISTNKLYMFCAYQIHMSWRLYLLLVWLTYTFQIYNCLVGPSYSIISPHNLNKSSHLIWDSCAIHMYI